MSSSDTSVEDGGRIGHGDRCSNISAYIMRSWAKSVERGVFLKNTLTSKKWVVASVTSRAQRQRRRAGLQPGGASSALIGARGEAGTTSGLQHAQPGRFKRAPVVPQTLILQSCEERNRLPSRARVFWLTRCVLGHWDKPHSAGVWGTHLDHRPLSTLLTLWVCAGIYTPKRHIE